MPSQNSVPIPKKGREAKVAIQCSHCGTKFRVKRSRLEDVSKVKCSNCGHVFKIKIVPPRKAASSTSEEQEKAILSSADKAYFEATHLGDEKNEEFSEMVLDDSDKEGLFMKPGAPLSKDQSPQVNDVDLRLSKLSDTLNGSSASREPQTDPLPPPEQFEPASSSDETTRPSQRSSSKLPIVEEEVDEGINWGKMTVIVLLLLTAFLVVAGVGMYGVFNEPSILNKILGTPLHQVEFNEKKGLAIKRVKNIPSRQTLHVVNGELTNKFSTSDEVSWIQLKGLAFDENRQVVETSIVFAGNVLQEEELSTWSLEKIKKYYKFNSGKNNSNFNLKEGQVVPFQIVFYESANVLANVTTKIVSYVRRNNPVYVRSAEE